MDNQVDELATAIVQMWRLLAQRSQVFCEQKVSTMLQMHALQFLDEHPSATVSEIANYLGTSLSSVTQLTDRLVKSGMIERLSDEADRRVIRVCLSNEGCNVLVRIQQAKRSALETAFAKIAAEDIKEYLRIQNQLIKSLQEIE